MLHFDGCLTCGPIGDNDHIDLHRFAKAQDRVLRPVVGAHDLGALSAAFAAAWADRSEEIESGVTQVFGRLLRRKLSDADRWLRWMAKDAQ